MVTHKDLLKILVTSNSDYEPWGKVKREEGDLWRPDCSCGCKYFIELSDSKLGADWGVCSNPKSHRAGLLTFEHQGCSEFKE